MKTSTANVSTPYADRYLTRLCRHFSHKIPATWENQQGEIQFAMGTCYLQAADESLSLRCESDGEENLDQLTEVVASHLVRFAAGAKEGEELTVTWQQET